jgi:membrane-associated protease RseP (regulator of RpoE activity)
MSDVSDAAGEKPVVEQAEFERLTTLVSAEFQIEESLMEQGIPTYYLKQPQETKQAFLRLLKSIDSLGLMAILRRQNGRIVLRVFSKPPIKPSNVMINWVLFFATIATTFITGYLLSGEGVDPLVGGVTFTIAIMTVLGLHELGHKITANRKGVDATPPYFIPGPPPMQGLLGIGTFGAVIVQKSLPPNKDSLFDIGASGPIFSFLLSIVVTSIGLYFSPITYASEELSTLPVPLLFLLISEAVVPQVTPPPGQHAYILLHPVAFAGWVGMLVTMLNLLPAAMLDGGHVSRSLFGERTRLVLTVLSIISLFLVSPIMALFVLFMAFYKHPGPLDDVSSLTTGRKLLAVGLLAILVLCSWFYYLIFYLLAFLGF